MPRRVRAGSIRCMGATKIKIDTSRQTRKKSRTEPPWNVVLYNDWNNSMPKVVYVLVRTIPGMNVRRAAALMYEAHSKGQATVKRCHRELAEMYAEKLQQRGLTAGAEAAR